MPHVRFSAHRAAMATFAVVGCLVLPVGCDNPQRDAGTVVVEPRATEDLGDAADDGRDALSADDR